MKNVQLRSTQKVMLENMMKKKRNKVIEPLKRIQDRGRCRRDENLEMVTQNNKVANKVIFFLELLRNEPEMVMSQRNLEKYRTELSLPPTSFHMVVDFLAKSPLLFEFYTGGKRAKWCGLTEAAVNLLEEEDALIKKNEDKAAEIVTRFLMMTAHKNLDLNKIAHFRRVFGMPANFQQEWVHKYPQHFKVVKAPFEKSRILQLVNPNPCWTVTELEKRVGRIVSDSSVPHIPGKLRLPFPRTFPLDYKVSKADKAAIDMFQRKSYLSPYADTSELPCGSLQKRAVAVMHELLSFTLEKNLPTTDHLTHFRKELLLPAKLMRVLLQHCGIFYVSERGRRLGVFLPEAYKGRHLIEKCPLVLWKEKLLSLVGYGKRRGQMCTGDVSDMESDHLWLIESGSEDESLDLKVMDEGSDGGFEEALEMDSTELETKVISSQYKS